MSLLETRLSRRTLLQATAVTGVAAGLGGVLAACGGAKTGTFNWMTWSDHWYKEELDAVKAAVNITANITELSDNSDGFLKLKEGSAQLDLISGDALWVTKYFDEGLISAFDLKSLEVSKQLYSVVNDFQFWTKPEGYLGYPFGWSPVLVAYNPKYVSGNPDSWDLLFDEKYKGRIVIENQPTDVMAYCAVISGAKDPYNMTVDEIAKAKDVLMKLKPQLLKMAQQNTETVAALVDESAWIATTNLGTQDRVKDASGPEVMAYTPKEGTVGWMDAEMRVKTGKNKDLISPFLEKHEQAEYVAENFLKYGRPLFNEKAYQLLKDKGEGDRADRYFYNQPEIALTMSLKGPGANTDQVINAFNEVMGV